MIFGSQPTADCRKLTTHHDRSGLHCIPGPFLQEASAFPRKPIETPFWETYCRYLNTLFLFVPYHPPLFLFFVEPLMPRRGFGKRGLAPATRRCIRRHPQVFADIEKSRYRQYTRARVSGFIFLSGLRLLIVILVFAPVDASGVGTVENLGTRASCEVILSPFHVSLDPVAHSGHQVGMHPEPRAESHRTVQFVAVLAGLFYLLSQVISTGQQ